MSETYSLTLKGQAVVDRIIAQSPLKAWWKRLPIVRHARFFYWHLSYANYRAKHGREYPSLFPISANPAKDIWHGKDRDWNYKS